MNEGKKTPGLIRMIPLLLVLVLAVIVLCALVIFAPPKPKQVSDSTKREIYDSLTKKDYNQTIKLMSKLNQKDGDKEFVCSTLGEANMGKGNYPEAVRNFESCAKLYEGQKKSALYKNLVGNAYRLAGNSDLAIKNYKDATILNPFSQTAWVNLVMIDLTRGEKAQAAESAKEGLELMPQSEELKNLLKKTRE